MRYCLYLLLLTLPTFAQPITDLSKIKPIPPIAPDLPAEIKSELESAVKKLGDEIEKLKSELKGKPDLLALLPDIQIYHNALRYPLQYREPIDIKNARVALADGLARIGELRAGKPDWVNSTGPRGYVSRIDRSVQPYILLVPKDYDPADKKTRHRFDFWCHGRNENLMELVFLKSRSEWQPTHGFVVQLYGRYCCANKFAGEIDCLEVMDEVKRRYSVDENRMVMAGFSMGGAAAWQFAVHYTDLWAAATPGAGFSESREFLKIPQEQVDAMQPWQRALWHWYDCTDYAANLAMLPTVAYTGELDGQKQASDAMIKAMEFEGLKLERLIGPKTAHKYEPETKKQLEAKIAEIVSKGRDPFPQTLRFTTWTLRYNRMYWITLEGLEKHWERARVDAKINANTIHIKTTNVSALTINIPANLSKFGKNASVAISLDGTKLDAKTNETGGLHVLCAKSGTWGITTENTHATLRKRPGLQGPIDDAFLDSFIIVKPTGKPLHDATAAWASSECTHAIDHWRKQFRGEAIVRDDTQITEADIRDNNLILFGDPSSNAMIEKSIDRLPFKWTKDTLSIANKTHDPKTHMPALIYPNPLNPTRYIVLNSGFTFREFDYLNNARQTPRLPDWAIIDITTPPNAAAPGQLKDANFFTESWSTN